MSNLGEAGKIIETKNVIGEKIEMEKVSGADKEIFGRGKVVEKVQRPDINSMDLGPLRSFDSFLSYILIPAGYLGILFLLMTIYLATLVDNIVEKIAYVSYMARHGKRLNGNVILG